MADDPGEVSPGSQITVVTGTDFSVDPPTSPASVSTATTGKGIAHRFRPHLDHDSVDDTTPAVPARFTPPRRRVEPAGHPGTLARAPERWRGHLTGGAGGQRRSQRSEGYAGRAAPGRMASRASAESGLAESSVVRLCSKMYPDCSSMGWTRSRRTLGDPQHQHHAVPANQPRMPQSSGLGSPRPPGPPRPPRPAIAFARPTGARP